MSSVATTKTARQEFWDGVRDEIPLMLGVFPFGMVFGVLGVEAGLEPLVVMAMSVIVFGGASQVVFVQMAGAGASGMVITAKGMANKDCIASVGV